MTPLTPKQMHAFRFIEAEIKAKGVAPSYRGIAAGLGMRSLSRVKSVVYILRRKGWITCSSEGHSIALVSRYTVELPPEIGARVDAAARSMGMPMADLVVAALTRVLR